MGWFGGHVLWLGFVVGFLVVVTVGMGGNSEKKFQCLAGMQMYERRQIQENRCLDFSINSVDLMRISIPFFYATHKVFSFKSINTKGVINAKNQFLAQNH